MTVKLNELLSPLKIVPFYEQRKNSLLQDLPPIAVELHWTSLCNYRCMHCSYGKRLKAKQSLSQECLHDVTTDLISMGVKAAYFSGGGEPTMLKNWESFSTSLQDAGVKTALVTNGVNLKDAGATVLSGMNYIAVSIYSNQFDVYHEITGSKFFDDQWTVPQAVHANNADVIVGARCVLNNRNYQEVVDLYVQAKSAGYDYLIFVPAVDYEGAGFGLTEQNRAIVHALIRNNAALFDDEFTNAKGLIKKGIAHYGVFEQPCIAVPQQCHAINFRTNAFINYCGGVWLCQPHIGNPLYKIGDVNECSIASIWNSPRHKEVIELLDWQYCQGNCENCRAIAYNRVIDGMEEHYDPIHVPYDPFL